MCASNLAYIQGAVEGLVDEAVIRRLIEHAGAISGPIYGRKGKAYLRQRIGGYNKAAYRSPWVVLVDLDWDAICAPLFRQSWLPNPAPYICFCVAVREIEAWLFADREKLAGFLSIPVSLVPRNPEAVNEPKSTMVNLAKRSRRREVRQDMVPRPGSGRTVGPAYASRLIEFTKAQWRPDVAANYSDSLRHCLHGLIKKASNPEIV